MFVGRRRGTTDAIVAVAFVGVKLVAPPVVLFPGRACFGGMLPFVFTRQAATLLLPMRPLAECPRVVPAHEDDRCVASWADLSVFFQEVRRVEAVFRFKQTIAGIERGPAREQKGVDLL